MTSAQSSYLEPWLQLFGCCVVQDTPAQRRPRIDRSMIGPPTNFIHTAHVGSGDVKLGANFLASLEPQMQSKGGYRDRTLSTSR